jgi:hypothetical protein
MTYIPDFHRQTVPVVGSMVAECLLPPVLLDAFQMYTDSDCFECCSCVYVLLTAANLTIVGILRLTRVGGRQE